MEIRIPHSQLHDFGQNTDVVRKAIAAKFEGDLKAIHRYDVTKMEDDHEKGVRILTLKPKSYFVMGGR